jgi:hypothetical protein
MASQAGLFDRQAQGSQAADTRRMSAQDCEAWINKIMQPIRQKYTDITQPQVRTAAEAHRANRSRRNA